MSAANLPGLRLPTDAECIAAVDSLSLWPWGVDPRPSTAVLVGYLGMSPVGPAVRVLGPKLSGMRRRGLIAGSRAAGPGRRLVARWGPSPRGDGWRTAEQMATEWGTTQRIVVGLVVKLGLRDTTAHGRGHGSAREYSPEAQGLIHREWSAGGGPK